MRNACPDMLIFMTVKRAPYQIISSKEKEIMKGMKKIIGAGIVAVLAVIAVYTFVAVKTENSSDKVQLRLAHGQAADS